MYKELNILFLSSWYPSRVNKSNGDFVQRHAEAIGTKHNVSIIYLITDKRLKVHKKVVYENLNNVKTTIVYFKFIKNRFVKNLVFISNYIKYISQLQKVDIIHINITYPIGIIGLFFKLTKSIPYIVTEHSTEYQNLKKFGYLKKFILKKILKNASKICPVSDNLKKSMLQLGFKGDYKAIPNVVNTEVFKPIKSELNTFEVTHISHMRNDHKNVKGILNVFSKLQQKIPNVKFNLIGKGASNYKNYIKLLNIKNICLIEQIAHKSIPYYLNKSHLFVLFSNYENLPCVILEAFSCGVPVVSTNVGGIKEYFPSNFGYLINVKDEEALEKSILKIYESELIIEKKIMHNYVEMNFGIVKICNSYSNIYNKILKN